MSNQLNITGLGLFTPLGKTVDKTWKALLAGEFIRNHARSSEIDICQMAARVAHEAIAQSGWDARELADPSTALVVGSSKGPVAKWLTAPPGNLIGTNFGLAELTTTVAREIGLGAGPRELLSAACASGIHALIHAVLLLRSGMAKRALVVAAEASVHPMFVGSFKRLGVLPPEGLGCRPFDQQRSGFLISEAAAGVCLESDRSDRRFAQIDRFALAGDAFHITGGDPEGKTLRHLLRTVVASRGVDLVHAHATGTIFNDPIELAAIESQTTHTDQGPIVYSHKGALGHSLGAAGLISVVLNCMSHRTGLIPPNTQTVHPIETRHVVIPNQSVHRKVQRSVALAAGFGGAMGAISLVT